MSLLRAEFIFQELVGLGEQVLQFWSENGLEWSKSELQVWKPDRRKDQSELNLCVPQRPRSKYKRSPVAHCSCPRRCERCCYLSERRPSVAYLFRPAGKKMVTNCGGLTS